MQKDYSTRWIQPVFDVFARTNNSLDRLLLLQLKWELRLSIDAYRERCGYLIMMQVDRRLCLSLSLSLWSRLEWKLWISIIRNSVCSVVSTYADTAWLHSYGTFTPQDVRQQLRSFQRSGSLSWEMQLLFSFSHCSQVLHASEDSAKVGLRRWPSAHQVSSQHVNHIQHSVLWTQCFLRQNVSWK